MSSHGLIVTSAPGVPESLRPGLERLLAAPAFRRPDGGPATHRTLESWIAAHGEAITTTRSDDRNEHRGPGAHRCAGAGCRGLGLSPLVLDPAVSGQSLPGHSSRSGPESRRGAE